MDQPELTIFNPDNLTAPAQQTHCQEPYDRPITLVEAAKFLPGRGKSGHIHVNALRRWSKKGFRGIKLRTIYVGVLLCTTRRWLDQFIKEINREQGAGIARDAAAQILNQAGI
jgi:hypothetical protein